MRVMGVTKSPLMKTSAYLTLVSLAVLATQASAASSQSATAVVVLPAYVVTAPHYLPVEQMVNASLNELRQQAKNAVFNPIAMPLIMNNTLRPPLPQIAVRDNKALSVGKV